MQPNQREQLKQFKKQLNKTLTALAFSTARAYIARNKARSLCEMTEAIKLLTDEQSDQFKSVQQDLEQPLEKILQWEEGSKYYFFLKNLKIQLEEVQQQLKGRK